MRAFTPTERNFEDHIEAQLNSKGYTSTYFSEYDRNLCLMRNQVIEFLQSTQPDEWRRLQEIFGVDAENKILSRISSEIGRRGIIDVLRNPVVDRGIYLNLCYFEPKSDLNPDHRRLYQSNHFSVVRQFHYSNQNQKSIDMVLFINGLPIVTMELKNQLTNQSIKDSEKQYKIDRDPKEPFLKFKRCLVHFCVDNDKVSMTTRLSGTKTVFLPYNRGLENPPVENGYRTEYLWKDVLLPSSLLDILENFVHVSKEKEFVFDSKTQEINTNFKEVLIFPRYHQLDLIRKFRSQLKTDGIGKNYLVQHTTGSGKSYSIGWLAHTLTSLYKVQGDTKRMFDSIIVVTDRTVLDNQLRNTIRSLAKVDGVVGGVQHGSKELKEFLEQGKDIIITTIQKFPFISESIASLSNKSFAVIIDEVHSSQSGEMSKDLKKTLSQSDDEVHSDQSGEMSKELRETLSNSGDELDDEDEFDYEKMITKEIESRGRQKHISFFGFTGTPKEKTLELFGTRVEKERFEPFHIYSMRQSIHEGFTLDVLQNYTTYKRYFKLKKTQDGDIAIPTGRGKRELVKYVDLHDMTIQNKVQIMLDHWIRKGSREIQGRARGMIVTQSRKHCVKYFDEVNRQLEERGLLYRCLVGFSGEVTVDHDKYTESGCNQTVDHSGDVPLALKNPKYRLLVVANKFQTGFDEPLVQTMYVDKKLGGVQCVQTLSRLNRTTSGKTHTFVLDFVNEPEEIRESFQRFYQSTFLEGETDPNSLYDTKSDIENYHLYTPEDVNRFCKVFYDRERDDSNLHPMLDHVVDKFKSIEDDETKEDFRSKIQSYIRLYGYLSQIINFKDIELEKTFVFLKYLNRKLPKRDVDRFDISDSADLDALRIQIQHKQVGELEEEDAIVSPLDFEASGVAEPEYDFLSELIKQVNSVHGVTLTEEDQVDISRLNKKVSNDSEVEVFMNGDNTEGNKKSYFWDQLDGMLVDYTNERFEFYKKLDDNPAAKNLIFQKMYEDYKKSKDQYFKP